MIIVYFITSQGRMKFVRPLFRALYESKMGIDLALDAFLQNKDFYHPICAKMIAMDLKIAPAKQTNETDQNRPNSIWKLSIIIGTIAATAGLLILRRK